MSGFMQAGLCIRPPFLLICPYRTRFTPSNCSDCYSTSYSSGTQRVPCLLLMVMRLLWDKMGMSVLKLVFTEATSPLPECGVLEQLKAYLAPYPA